MKVYRRFHCLRDNCSPVLLSPAINLSPVTTTPAITENLWKGLIADIVDSLTPMNNLSSVLLTPVINIHSRISPDVSTKFNTAPMEYLRALGMPIREKNWSQKSRVRLSLIAGDGVRGMHAVAGGPLARHLPPQHPLPHRGGARQAPLKTPNQIKPLVPNRFC